MGPWTRSHHQRCLVAHVTMKQIAADEIKKHNSEKDCWLVVHGKVYNVTEFLADHPGGKKVLVRASGADASEEFDMLHKPEVLEKYAKDYQIGVLAPGAKLCCGFP